MCIETELFVLLVLDSTVWCVGFDHYPPQKVNQDGFSFSTAHFGMTNTQVSSRTQTLAHADVAEMRSGLPDGSLHLITAHDDSVWCTEITASFVIHLLFLLFFSAHVLWHFGRSLALLISINILFKNKRKTVYNTYHNHTWFLHKMFQNKLSLLKAILSSDSDPLVAAAASRPGGLCLCGGHSSWQAAVPVLLFWGEFASLWVGWRLEPTNGT